MSIRLLYDPKRVIKLRKNDLLNELKSRFSQRVFEVFQTAEKSLWKEDEENFEFLNKVFNDLYDELEHLQEDLNRKAEAWVSVAKAENSGKTINIKKTEASSKNLDFAAQKEIVPYSPQVSNANVLPVSNASSFAFPSQSKQSLPIEEDEFNFFEEF